MLIDVVAVELLHQSTWISTNNKTSDNIEKPEATFKYKNTDELNEYLIKYNIQPKGKVVKIINTTDRITRHVGVLVPSYTVKPNQKLAEAELFVVFRPSDPRYNFLKVNRLDLPDAYVNNPYENSQKIYVAEIGKGVHVYSCRLT